MRQEHFARLVDLDDVRRVERAGRGDAGGLYQYDQRDNSHDRWQPGLDNLRRHQQVEQQDHWKRQDQVGDKAQDGIEPTPDRRAVKRAFAKRVKTIDQETEAEA